MDAMKEANKFLTDKNCIWDQPALRHVIGGLMQIIDVERKEHAKEMREAIRDAAAHAVHSQNEYGGRDM